MSSLVSWESFVKNARSLVLVASLGVALSFHVFASPEGRGMGLAMFGFLVMGLLIALVRYQVEAPNTWARVFLAPAAAFFLATGLYSNDMTRFFWPALGVLSLMLYSYWSSVAPMSWKAAPSLVRASFAFEGVGLLASTKEALIPPIRSSDRWKSVLMGAVIAFPVLAILAMLFASADPAFDLALRSLFDGSLFAWLKNPTLILDALIFAFALRYGWLLVTRQREQRAVLNGTSRDEYKADAVMYTTAFVLVNVLVAVFVWFQAGAFFGGESWMRLAEDITYADRARRGFFEMVFAGGFVGLASLTAFYAGALHDRWTRLSFTVLTAQVGVILLSAAWRLSLYIGAYGLTMDRVWRRSSWYMSLCALGCFLAVLYTRRSVADLLKFGTVGTLGFLACISLWNMDGAIARVNIDRFITRSTAPLDVPYIMNGLSMDADLQKQRLMKQLQDRVTQDRDLLYWLTQAQRDSADQRKELQTRFEESGWRGVSLREWAIVRFGSAVKNEGLVDNP
jgi:hypothetical protein